MKKIIYLLIACVSIVFVACENNDDEKNAWAKANEEAYENIKADASWTEITNYLAPTGPRGVYRKAINWVPKDDNSIYPIQTAEVKVFYKGYFHDGTVFDPGTSASTSGVPVAFRVNGVIRGFDFALQNMVVGDKWEICIPWYLGYGDRNTGSIRAYSTLFFEVELVEINQHP
jgi:FKBP-type peptidyl-prolyl cis-trans isomerase